VLGPHAIDAGVDWLRGASSLPVWLILRVLELTYTAWDLEPYAHDVGYDGPPFRWEPARRFLLRCELDAAFFHLYGLSRDDTDYVMDTFPIVRKNDEKAHGEYRTKRVILEVYNAMAEATEWEAVSDEARTATCRSAHRAFRQHPPAMDAERESAMSAVLALDERRARGRQWRR